MNKDTIKNIVIYTDGSCIKNPGPGGWSFLIINENEQLIQYGHEKDSTNNRMELMAVIGGLKKCIEIFGSNINTCKLILHTDSKYVETGITDWIFKWVKNNWITSTKQPVKNKDLWEELHNISQSLDGIISWNWVRAHNGNMYNEKVDKYAKIGAQEQKSNIIRI